MIIILQNILDSKEELEREIQSQFIFLFSPQEWLLFLSSLTKILM